MAGGRAPLTVPGPRPAGAGDELAAARKLLESGRLAEAHSAAAALVAQDPAAPEPLYLQAVAERYLGRFDAALGTLGRLHAAAPRYARGWQEEGHVRKALGDRKGATAAFRRAVELNRGLVASWRELAALYAAEGSVAAQAAAEAEYRRLAALPPELVSVTSLIQEGRLHEAEQLCRAFLKANPHHVEAMRLLARIGMKLFIYDDAEFLLESCVAFAPDYWLARRDYVEVLHKRQKFPQAYEQAKLLRERWPGRPPFELGYANECVATGRFEEAIATYDAIIGRNPELEQPHLVRGHALKTVGRLDEAIESYRNARAARSDFGDAWWSLANLKTYRFTDEEVAAMERAAADGETAAEDRFHIAFALGKAFEDRGEHARSFDWYRRGNTLRRSGLRYDPQRAEAAMRRHAQVCTAEFFRAREGWGASEHDPIFIVGLPRSGSTLLEQILASHSQVDGTMELPNIVALAHRLNGRRLLAEEARYPSVLAELSAAQCGGFGGAYIADTAFHRRGAPRFIDKMPNNFLHVGLIHLILPNARIIDARRHPLACCFANYKQLFADGQEFTYDLAEMARFYRAYAELMDHWDRVLPGRILRVHYEHVVAGLEEQTRRILEFLGLPFEETCLEFHRTRRSVRTPSSEQVRRPIYRDAVSQWRHFEPFLGEASTPLADLVASYPEPSPGNA